MKQIRRITAVFLMIAILCGCLLMTGCSDPENKVIIYTSAEDYRVEYLRSRLNEEFPQYDITIEYMTTGNHAAKLLAEGLNTDCDIIYDLEYTYLQTLEKAGNLADLSAYDFSVYCDDVNVSRCFMPEYRNGGAVVINPAVLERYQLAVPTCYDDLLKPEYKGLVSMPNPTSSGTGYMFLLSMINERGEEEAFRYFEAFSDNVLQFTSSGSGPVNALVQGEVAVGLTSTGVAVNAIREGTPLEILYFDEGSPYSLYGQAVVKGKEQRQAVRDVYDFLYGTYGYENCEKFFPEPIFDGVTYEVEHYPTAIVYSDMSGDTPERKDELLSKWNY